MMSLPFRCLTFWGLILGKFLVLVAKIFFTSINPIWWSNYHNSFLITVIILSTLEKIVSGMTRT